MKNFVWGFIIGAIAIGGAILFLTKKGDGKSIQQREVEESQALIGIKRY